jgi:branched-chain amino acid transport system substrate-binding protein
MTIFKGGKTMRKGALFAVLCCALLVVGTSASAQGIKIGILTELSGPLGPGGAGQRDGFLLYLKKTGGRFAGLPVETVIEDTGGDPSTAIAKAKKLIESDRVDLLFGPLSSATGAAIKGYVVGQQMPTLMEATVNEISDGKYIFRTTFTGNEESYLTGFLAGKAGYRKAVAIAPNFNAGQGAVEYFEKGFAAAGGTVVQKLLPRLGTPDYGSFIGQMSAEADVGIVLMIGGDAVRFMKQYADFGKKLPLYGPTATVDDTLLPAQGKAAEGFIGQAFYFPSIDSPDNKSFVAEWEKSFKGKPSWYAAAGYAAGQIMDDALRRVKGNVRDKEGFVKALKETRLNTPSGPFRFDANNNPVQPRYVIQIREVGGAVQPVIFATIPEFRSESGPPALPANLAFPKR